MASVSMNENQTILLVDDSENDLLLMRLAFEKAEFSGVLQEVHNGEEAIGYLKGDGPFGDRAKFPLPAVVLMDLNMPRKNGFDVLTWVRAQAGLRRISIIIMSASMRPEDVERSFDLGANSFVVKPSTLDELIAMIRSLGGWLQHNHFPSLKEVARA
jgi:CheY-like chemotaxis protein